MSQIENTPELNTPSIDTNIPEANIPEIEQGETGKDVVLDPSLGSSGSTECNVCSMLETISAPGLSSSNYGQDIESVFANIDKNFKVVANHDFIKGENGDTIEVEYVKLNDGEIGKKLYNALKSALFEENPCLVSSYSWDEDITNYEVPLVKIVNINKEEYIGSATPILFIDYRFSSNVLASISQDSYIDVTNLSCIVNFKYSNNEWMCEIDNSFPRIQYNSSKKYFEWLLNNNGTTISATGIKGDKGDKLTMHFKDNVDINTKTTSNTFEVPYNKEEIISEGDPVLLYLYDEANYKGYYISYIKSVNENTFEVEYDENYVNKLDFAKNTYEFFKSLNINNIIGNEPARGIFLPFNNTTNNNAHVIYNDSLNKLNICTVDNYDNFSNRIPSAIKIDAKDSSINMDQDIKLQTQYSKLNVNEESIVMNSNIVNITSVEGINIEVTGDQPTNNVTIDSDVNITGSVSSSLGFYQTSDERLKEFKGDINIDLDKLLLLPKKYFTWKLDRNGKMEIGTSAQEVQKLYPELVTKDLEGKLVVAYDKLSIVALRAIDVLNSKNKELEARIERLEKLMK